nr:hypothetical protein CFP56_00737 [Quercus suber]
MSVIVSSSGDNQEVDASRRRARERLCKTTLTVVVLYEADALDCTADCHYVDTRVVNPHKLSRSRHIYTVRDYATTRESYGQLVLKIDVGLPRIELGYNLGTRRRRKWQLEEEDTGKLQVSDHSASFNDNLASPFAMQFVPTHFIVLVTVIANTEHAAFPTFRQSSGCAMHEIGFPM